MNITKTEDNGTVTVTVSGWLDVQTTPELRAFLSELPPSRDLIFDFEELEYISSAGIREVVAAYRRQQQTGGTFAIVKVNPDVMNVFTMTGLHRKISISS